jgi:hypothetical protein
MKIPMKKWDKVLSLLKGEYRCTICNNIVALYRKFNK